MRPAAAHQCVRAGWIGREADGHRVVAGWDGWIGSSSSDLIDDEKERKMRDGMDGSMRDKIVASWLEIFLVTER